MSTLKFFFMLSHFWLFCKDCRYSFLQQVQNSLAICWIHYQCLLKYSSGLLSSPGGVESVYDSMVNVFIGDHGCKLVGSLRNSAVSGQKFKMWFTSVIRVERFIIKHSPWVFKSSAKMALAKWICCFQTIWLGFLYHQI